MRASVVVPVKNGGDHLVEVLAALRCQDLPGGLEVIAIDSGSEDRSREAVRASSSRLVEVPARSFDHGETRNLGAREAKGDFVLFLSQDACPAGRGYVRALVEALEAQPRVAGAFGRQTPRPDADPLTRRDLSAWVASGTTPRTVFAPAGYEDLTPLERYRLSAFDNVASVVRRPLLLEHPFPPSRFGEDLEWSEKMLRLGHGIAFVPAAVVVHSHPRTAQGLFRRNYLGHRLLHRLFGLTTVPDRRHLVRAAAGALSSDLAELRRAGAPLAAWVPAPAQAVAATYGQYLGARDESLGLPYPGWA
jgi:rhamnosyltransferase